jgi:hypothetical protein
MPKLPTKRPNPLKRKLSSKLSAAARVDHLRDSLGHWVVLPRAPAKTSAEYEEACRKALESLHAHRHTQGAKIDWRLCDARMWHALAALPARPVKSRKAKYQRKRAKAPKSNRINFSDLDADVRAALADQRIMECLLGALDPRTMSIFLSLILSGPPPPQHGAPRKRTMLLLNRLIIDCGEMVRREGPTESMAELVRRLQDHLPEKWGDYPADTLERMLRGTGAVTDWK